MGKCPFPSSPFSASEWSLFPRVLLPLALFKGGQQSLCCMLVGFAILFGVLVTIAAVIVGLHSQSAGSSQGVVWDM